MKYTGTIAIAALLAWGCGSSVSLSSPDSAVSLYEGAVSSVTATGGATTNSTAVSSGVLYDASSTSTGSGQGSDGPTSINDTSTTSCAFTFDAVSTTTGISVVSDSNSCADKNRCIVCTAATSAPDCSISCTGTVPSDAATAADTFNVYLTLTSTFRTNMPGTTGMVRLDERITNWPEFDFTIPGHFTLNLDGCDGAPDMTLTTTDPVGIDATTATSFTKGFTISALDATPTGGLGDCSMVSTFKAAMPLTGADTPDATVTLARGSVASTSKICDTASATYCAGPQ